MNYELKIVSFEIVTNTKTVLNPMKFCSRKNACYHNDLISQSQDGDAEGIHCNCSCNLLLFK